MQSAFRAALTAMQAAFPSASVSVVSDGVTGTGLRGPAVDETAMQTWGEMGQATNAVRVSMETFSTVPTRGSTVVIDGEKCTVTNARPDNADATMLITYRVQQPNEVA